MKIAYITDQFLPQTAIDTAQRMSMVSAFGQRGAQVELVTPRSLFGKGPDAASLAAYYQVLPRFALRALLDDDDILNRLGARASADAAVRTWYNRAGVVLEFVEQRLRQRRDRLI